jgi:hypothetical protein
VFLHLRAADRAPAEASAPGYFLPYRRPDEGQDTAMNLAWCWSVVQRHGGELLVNDDAGFTLVLPAADWSMTSSASDHAPAPRRLRVLVAEDDPQVSQVLATMLDQLGHTPVSPEGADAPLDLIIGEAESADRLTERHPEVPVLLLHDAQDLDRDSGTIALAKPVALAHLRTALAGVRSRAS